MPHSLFFFPTFLATNASEPLIDLVCCSRAVLESWPIIRSIISFEIVSNNQICHDVESGHDNRSEIICNVLAVKRLCLFLTLLLMARINLYIHAIKIYWIIYEIRAINNTKSCDHCKSRRLESSNNVRNQNFTRLSLLEGNNTTLIKSERISRAMLYWTIWRIIDYVGSVSLSLLFLLGNLECERKSTFVGMGEPWKFHLGVAYSSRAMG